MRRKLDELGVIGTSNLVLKTGFERIAYRNEHLFYADLPGYSVEVRALSAEASARETENEEQLTRAELAALEEYGGPAYAEQARERLRRGWRLWMGSVAGAVAGGGWAVTNATEYATKVVPLLDTDISIIDCFTLPAFRGKRVYPAVLVSIAHCYRERGFLRAWGYVNERNAASIRGLEKAGFRNAVRYESYGIGQREVVIWKSRYRRTRPS